MQSGSAASRGPAVGAPWYGDKEGVEVSVPVTGEDNHGVDMMDASEAVVGDQVVSDTSVTGGHWSAMGVVGRATAEPSVTGPGQTAEETGLEVSPGTPVEAVGGLSGGLGGPGAQGC